MLIELLESIVSNNFNINEWASEEITSTKTRHTIDNDLFKERAKQGALCNTAACVAGWSTVLPGFPLVVEYTPTGTDNKFFGYQEAFTTYFDVSNSVFIGICVPLKNKKLGHYYYPDRITLEGKVRDSDNRFTTIKIEDAIMALKIAIKDDKKKGKQVSIDEI